MKVLSPKAAANASLEAALSMVHDQAGEELNSTQTVSSYDPSTAEIRIGAQNMGGTRQLLPRAYYTSLLVLVPRQNLVETSSYSRGNADSQKTIPVDTTVAYFKADGRAPDVDSRGSVVEGDVADWHRCTTEVSLPTYNDDIFADCDRGGQLGERTYKCGISESATVFDDGKTATVDIGGISGNANGDYSAIAIVTQGGTAYTVQASAIAPNGKTGILTAIFPTFEPFADSGATPKVARLTGIILYHRSSGWYRAGSSFWPVGLRNVTHKFILSVDQQKNAEPGWAVTIEENAIRATANGTGQVILNTAGPVGKSPVATTIRVTGAGVSPIVPTDCPTLKSDAGLLQVSSAGKCKLPLINLEVSEMVKIISSPKGGKDVEKTLRVSEVKPEKTK
jgi:hypothetical protein